MATDPIATAAFKANPVTFLGGNMILPPIGNALRHSRSEHLGLAATAFNGTTTPGGLAIPVWQVSKAPKGEAYFRSYIADYEQGATTFTMLGANEHAEFCFTANMNGCTFGLGIQAGDGTLIVSHGNAANTGLRQNYDSSAIGPVGLLSPGKTAMQNALQLSRALAGHGPGGRVFEPEHYRFTNRLSVTFGYRPRVGPGNWTFYFINYTRAGLQVVSYGVQPMPTNSLTI